MVLTSQTTSYSESEVMLWVFLKLQGCNSSLSIIHTRYERMPSLGLIYLFKAFLLHSLFWNYGCYKAITMFINKWVLSLRGPNNHYLRKLMLHAVGVCQSATSQVKPSYDPKSKTWFSTINHQEHVFHIMHFVPANNHLATLMLTTRNTD